MQFNRALRVLSAITEWRVVPAFAAGPRQIDEAACQQAASLNPE
jgi:hypothetical protein